MGFLKALLRCAFVVTANASSLLPTNGTSAPNPQLAPRAQTFGYSNSNGVWTVNTGSDLSFKIRSSNCDLISLTYKGIEITDSTAGASQIGSGLGTISASITTINNQYIKITCNHANLIHYYVARSGSSNVYMATYGISSPSTFEMRFLFRLKNSVLPYSKWPSAQRLNEGTIVEGADVNKLSNGETHSKFYSSERFIENQVFGAYGNSIGAYFVVPDYRYETSSGGPFFRDINVGAGTWMGISHYMNSAHLKTEPYRDDGNLHGPYLFAITDGGEPSKTQDLEFFSLLGVRGFVPKSSRGYVKGTTSGIPSSSQTVVAWSNAKAQYWCVASGATFISPPMKAGTYTQILYKGEKPVNTLSVTVTAGTTVTKDIASTESTKTPIWRIGTFDGQPFELKNGRNFLRMHPSDYRMTPWTGTFTIGSSKASDFPMAVFKSVNNPTTIKFTLSSSQIGARTLRIGTTVEFAGGRPQAKVNSWTGPAPASRTGIPSRSVTRGAYRGFGYEYLVNIPSGILIVGVNTIEISVISGSSGSDFLSPNFIYDAVELY